MRTREEVTTGEARGQIDDEECGITHYFCSLINAYS